MATSMKQVAVVLGDEVHDVTLRPGTTAAELLQHFGLEPKKYWVSPRDGGVTYGEHEVISDSVPDHGKLWITSPASVGER